MESIATNVFVVEVMMSKLPKSLSSIRVRSSSLANRSQDWQHRTTERSGSRIIAAMIKSGPREPNTLEEKIATIVKRIKREQMRLQKAKAFGTVPIGRETEESKAREAYILKKDGIINRYIFLLQELNAEKQKLDKREISKFQNNPKSGEFVGKGHDFVRLEKGKIVPRKQTVLVHHRNSPSAFIDKVKSMAEIVREEKKKRKEKTFRPEIQQEIDKVFLKLENPIDEDEFDDLMDQFD